MPDIKPIFAMSGPLDLTPTPPPSLPWSSVVTHLGRYPLEGRWGGVSHMALRCQRMKHSYVVTSEKELGIPVFKRSRTTDKSRLSQTKGTLHRVFVLRTRIH